MVNYGLYLGGGHSTKINPLEGQDNMSLNYFINQFDLPEPPSVCEHGITEGDFGYTDCKECQPDELDENLEETA